MAFLAKLHRQIDQGWDDDPADGSDDRKDRFARVLQFPGDHLAFDLQSDHKEEDGHQNIVDDQVTEVPIDFEFSELESHMGMPEFFERLIPRGVGDDKRDQGREHQNDAAGSLDVQEAFYRDEPLGDPWDGDLVGALADRLVGHRIPIDVGLAVVSIRRQQTAEH